MIARTCWPSPAVKGGAADFGGHQFAIAGAARQIVAQPGTPALNLGEELPQARLLMGMDIHRRHADKHVLRIAQQIGSGPVGGANAATGRLQYNGRVLHTIEEIGESRVIRHVSKLFGHNRFRFEPPLRGLHNHKKPRKRMPGFLCRA